MRLKSKLQSVIFFVSIIQLKNRRTYTLGVFEWTVVGKVTDYGQNVTLFCHVPNCCPKDAGWDRWTPHQRTLFIDVKSGRPNKKYDGKVAKDGYTLIIQNLTKNDLNVSYSCLYGVTLGEQKFLLAEDVFTYMSTAQPNVDDRISEGQIAGIIVGIVVLVAVTLSIGLLVFHFHRPKTKRNSGGKREHYNYEVTAQEDEAETDNNTNEVVKKRIDKESESFKKAEIDNNKNEGIEPLNEKGREYSDLNERIIEIETEQKEVIPFNIRDLIRRQINEWEKKDVKFVSTRASDYVMNYVQGNNCVTLTAPAGVGKSFISRHTALVLQKEGYNIIPVYAPTDIRDYYQPGKQTVFIVDDICGNYTANQQQIDKWKQMIPVINTIVADKCCKIIVSCRLQVYKDDKFKILTPFKSCECNLVSDELCLTSDEKTNIAKNYIGINVLDIDDLSQNSDFFPLLCSLYHAQSKSNMKEFFRNPFVIYKDELDKLSHNGDEGNYKMCSLALCVLLNNDLKESWFQGKMTDEQRQIIEDTCEACEINRSTSKAKLKKALDTLDGTLIFKQDGIYRTVHDKLFDFLAHYFGQKMIECLIDHGDSYLVHERLIWQNASDDINSDIDFIIEIPDYYLKSYFKRLIKDWSAGKVSDVFDNNNMKVSSFRQQLLHYLLQLNKLQQVKLANIKDTVRPKNEFGAGNTPLIDSCYEGYHDMVEWLLHNTADVDQCKDDGTTGLCMASAKGYTDIVKLLLVRTSNVDLCNKDGWSPLNSASHKGHTDIVQLLLEKNPNGDLCNNGDWSPLNSASAEGHTDIVQLLLEKNPNVDLCNKDGFSPLHSASHAGHTDIVQLLLEKNPNVDLCNKAGFSPLNSASAKGHTEIVKLLLESNPNVDLCNDDGWSPLKSASAKGHTDIVKLLLEKNPNVDLCTDKGFSPLINSCSSNQTSIIQLLMKHKPNINAQTYDGGSALYFSALNGNKEITELLLENNADCNICIQSKQSLEDTFTKWPGYSLYKGKQSLFDSLVNNTSLIVTDHVRKKSVDYAFDVVAGSSPLHIACFMGRTGVVSCLLDHNANIHMTKEDGSTPLFYACEVGHSDIVHLLLDKGADTQICRLNGETPVSVATDNEHSSIVIMLTNHTKKEEIRSS